MTVRYELINLLSLDVVAGAIAGASFAVTLLSVHPGMAFWICLPVAVWLIYTTDHLLDGLKNREKSRSIRHFFHYRYRFILGTAIVIFGAIAAVVAFNYLPIGLVRFGILIGALSLLYLFITWYLSRHSNKYFFKEVVIAFIYIIGIWGGPLILFGYRHHPVILIILPIYLSMALINLFTLSYFDLETDRQDRHNSFTVIFGKKVTLTLILLLLTLGFILSVSMLLLYTEERIGAGSIILMVMILFQFLIVIFKDSFFVQHHHRPLGEAIFILPALLPLYCTLF